MTQVTSAKAIGVLVRQRRKEAGLTLKDAAGMAGVGVRFLSELERGKATLQLGLVIEVLLLFGLELYVRPRGARQSLAL
jgi:y4mF family transcriptional regulator